MKKYVIKSLVFFGVSYFIQYAYKFVEHPVKVNPFPLKPDIAISTDWLAKHYGELVSYSFMMLAICYVLNPIERHFREKRTSFFALYIFTRMWHRVFWVIFFTSLLDIVNYALSFKRNEYFFLIQNGLFLILTCYFIYKTYKR